MRLDNPYLEAWVQEWAAGGDSTAVLQELALSQPARPAQPQSPYCVPYHVAEIVEPPLDMVKPSEWTVVSSDDELMKKLMTCYFLHVYHSAPAFQKDYSLQDMAAGRQGLCSSLLINSILAVSCVSGPRVLDRSDTQLSCTVPLTPVVTFRLRTTSWRDGTSIGTPNDSAASFWQKPRGCGKSRC